MRPAAVAGLLALLAVGVSLVATVGGDVAVGYAIGAAAVVIVLTLRRLEVWLPPPPTPAAPLVRALRRPGAEAPRPIGLRTWEEDVLAAVTHGWAARALGRRLAPVVGSRLRDRRGMEPEDPGAAALLGGAWAQLAPGPTTSTPALRLDDLDELTRNLEAL